MGFTGLARWQNAPTTGLDIIGENIVNHHRGQPVGRWQLTIRSYRSNFGAILNNIQPLAERSMCTLTMGDNVFVLLEDPSAPSRAEFLAAQEHAKQQHAQQQRECAEAGNISPSASTHPTLIPPSHYRMSLLTFRPPGAIEHLLQQLRARWTPARQAAQTMRGAIGGTSSAVAAKALGQQLVIDGTIFSIGRDWLVRVGNVVLAGGAVKGMLIEAEYLPLPLLHSSATDGTSDLLSNLLTALLPNFRDAKTAAVIIDDAQWEEVLYDRETEAEAQAEAELQDEAKSKPSQLSQKGEDVEMRDSMVEESDDDDLFTYADEDKTTQVKRGDWMGLEREKRSAFLIMGALKSEGIV